MPSPRFLLLTGLAALPALPKRRRCSKTPGLDPAGSGAYLEDADCVPGDEGDAVAAFGRAACMRGCALHREHPRRGLSGSRVLPPGGGACWDDYCLAVTTAPLGCQVDILDPDLDENPVSEWNVAYLPYCDGSLFVGDADHDDDGDGGRAFHRGLANLSAALELSETSPTRTGAVRGSSGGSYGVLFALPLLRAVYPDAELLVLSDSAVGVARGGDGFVERPWSSGTPPTR